MPRDYKNLNSKDDIQFIENKFNIKIELYEIDITKLEKLKQEKPDFLALSYAGGFQDPEGFLKVITASLSSSLESIFSENYKVYLEASTDQDWTSRTKKYQTLNKLMITSGQVIPAWKLLAIKMKSKSLTSNGENLRCSTLLKDYK